MSDNSWCQQLENLDKPGQPRFIEITLDNNQMTKTIWECKTCKEQFVWVEKVPYLLCDAVIFDGKTPRGYKAKVYALTGLRHERGCQEKKNNPISLSGVLTIITGMIDYSDEFDKKLQNDLKLLKQFAKQEQGK